MVYFFVIIANFFNSLASKRSTIIPLIGMGWLTILAANAGTLGSVDYGTYSRGYTALSYSDTSQFEWGYTLLEKWTISLGMDYDQFRLVIFSISFLMLFLAIKNITNNIANFVWLFAIFPFINEANQVRNFAMMSFGILALSYYMVRHKLLIPMLLIIVSASFHSLGYLFILIIAFNKLIPTLSMRSLSVFGVSGFFLSLFLLLFNGLNGLIGKIIAKIFVVIGRSDGSNATTIFNAYGSGTASSTKTMLSFIFIFILMIIYLVIVNKEFSIEKGSKISFLIEAVFLIGLIGIVVLPASIQNQRILRNAITILLIVHSYLNSVKISKRTSLNKNGYIFRTVIILLILVVSVNTFDGGYFSDTSLIQPTIKYLLQIH